MMDSFLDTTSNNDIEISSQLSIFVLSPKKVNCDVNKTIEIENNTCKREFTNIHLKERLISAQNHLQKIENKKKIIDKRQESIDRKAYSTLNKMAFLNTRINLVAKLINEENSCNHDEDNGHDEKYLIENLVIPCSDASCITQSFKKEEE